MSDKQIYNVHVATEKWSQRVGGGNLKIKRAGGEDVLIDNIDNLLQIVGVNSGETLLFINFFDTDGKEVDEDMLLFSCIMEPEQRFDFEFGIRHIKLDKGLYITVSDSPFSQDPVQESEIEITIFYK